MNDKNVLPSSLRSRMPISAESGDFQSLVHAAVCSAKRIKGMLPVIVPVSKNSPVGLYANLHLKASVYENPWDIIQSIARCQTYSAEFCLSPKQEKRGQSRRIQWHQNEPRCARIRKRAHGNAYNTRRASLPLTEKNSSDSILIQHKRVVISANTTCGYSHTLTERTIHPHFEVLRAPHSRKYVRVFSYEIENIMHGFGEVRYCSPSVLEFVENTVRNITQRVALGILSRFNTETLTVCNISTCIRHDPNALYRLLFCLRRAGLHGEDLHVVRPVHRDWDSFLHHATIHGIKIEEFPSLKILEHIPVVRIHNKCTESARSIFWRVLGVLFKLQHKQSIQSSLTARDSRDPVIEIQIGGRRRLDIFREWLALPDYVKVNEGSLHALGNLAREAIGVITQTALVLRHRNESFHSYEKLLVTALGYGIGAGVAISLSGTQTFELLSIMEDIENTAGEKTQWTIRPGKKTEGLQITQVREAWRQLDDPEALASHRPFWFGM